MRTDLIDIGADTPGQSNVLRVLVFEGLGAGPGVYMQAGLHAQELPGLVALDRLIPKLTQAEQEGRLRSTVTLVPSANPIGLSQAIFETSFGRFDMHSRTNFNRDFPRAPRDLANRSVVEKLKATLLDLAASAEVVLDLHCDDEGPVYLYTTEDMLDNARRLSAALGAFAILTSKPGEGSQFDVAAYLRRAGRLTDHVGGHALAATVELRGMLDVSDDYAERDASGLYRYLASIGCVEDAEPELEPNNPHVLDEALAELVPTPVPGVVLYEIEIGDGVMHGQCVARILSEAGMPSHAIPAPFDGVVMTRRERRFLRKGEHVVKILRGAVGDHG